MAVFDRNVNIDATGFCTDRNQELVLGSPYPHFFAAEDGRRSYRERSTVVVE